MATDFVTDTHALIWYLEDSPRLGSQALAAFAACDRDECLIYVPTIFLVEIVYPVVFRFLSLVAAGLLYRTARLRLPLVC